MSDIKLNIDFDVIGAVCKSCDESLKENRLMIAHIGVGHRVYVVTRVRTPGELHGKKLQIAMMLKET